jgi:hypothetical protein
MTCSMGRQFEHLGTLLQRGRPIVPLPVLPVEVRIVEHGLWWVRANRQPTQHLSIVFEENEDDPNHLAGNAPDHFGAARILARFLVESAFQRHQALVELGPLAIRTLDRGPHYQVHGGLHAALPARSQPGVIERGARLFDGGRPAKIGLEPGRARKVGDIADTGNDRRGLRGANPGDGRQDLAFTARRHNPRHLRVQLRQVLLNEDELSNELVLLKGEAAQTRWVFRADTVGRQLLEM